MGDRNILEWDETDVQNWLASLGYPQYESQILGWFIRLPSCLVHANLSLLENGISGDILSILDADALKSLGVTTIGQRLAILKAIYLVKVAYDVPIAADHYVPPCKDLAILHYIDLIFRAAEASERLEGVTVEKLHSVVKDQGMIVTTGLQHHEAYIIVQLNDCNILKTTTEI